MLFTLAAMLPQTALFRGGFAASSAKLDSSSGNDDHRFQLSIQYKLIRWNCCHRERSVCAAALHRSERDVPLRGDRRFAGHPPALWCGGIVRPSAGKWSRRWSDPRCRFPESS